VAAERLDHLGALLLVQAGNLSVLQRAHIRVRVRVRIGVCIAALELGGVHGGSRRVEVVPELP